jgi:phage recombination protein Bet
MSKKTEEIVPVSQARSVLTSMSARYNCDSTKLLDTLKNTAFKGATNEQLMALCIVADQYRLNPFTTEIYAFPDKNGGIVPVVGIDGWLRIINDHPQFDGMEVEGDDDQCTCTIFRKDRQHATSATEYMEECRRKTGPWESHPRRMLRHKAIIQAARVAFGFSIKDPDEAERIIEAEGARAPIAMPVAKGKKPDAVIEAEVTVAPEQTTPEPDDLPM